jgi:ATP-dependent exoDNAse (exonuclease V) beta subunit
LGLDLMDNEGTDARAARREVLARLFTSGAAGEGGRREFMDAVKAATFGREEKGLEANLDRFLTDYRASYRAAPAAQAWGDERILWPGGRRWPAPTGDAAGVAAEFIDHLSACGWPEDLRAAAEKFAAFAGAHSELTPWAEPVMKSAFAQRMLESVADLEEGRFELTYRRKPYALDGAGARALAALLRHVLGTEISRSLRETRGLYQVLHHFERLYDAQVRRHGRLTFEDVQYLLTQTHEVTGCVISRSAGDPARLYIDYRLDSRLDHWLLDEFQDTSDLQWETLRNLVDEVLQDSSGERSFFYVGDVKQAIYGWRGGNPSLFGRLLDRYGDRIQTRPLHTSYRSAPAVLDLVNRVFGTMPEALPAPVRERWARIWGEHSPAPGLPASGYACLIEPPLPEEGKPTDEDRQLVAAAVLRELEPVRRGLSAAVLARSNAEVQSIVACLRAELPGVPVVQEGVSPLMANPVAALLRSVLHLAAHPGDTFAWRHVEMSPLGPEVAPGGANGLSHAVLRQVQEDGFEATIRHWGERLAAAGGLDEYGRACWESLLEAGGEFDAAGGRDINAFEDFVDGYELREEAPGSAIRVMTIHQSKGLGFDIVVLPDLQGRSLTGGGAVDFALHREAEDERPRWALKLPRRAVAELDPVLEPALRRAEEAASFESLCVLYVALTRAKRGLYCITSFPGRSSTAFTAAAMLKEQLTGEALAEGGAKVVIGGREAGRLWESGEAQWFAGVAGPAQPASRPPRARKSRVARAAARRRLLSAAPSQGAEHVRSGDLVFAASARRSRGFGSAVHALFSRIRWWPDSDLSAATAAWRAGGEWEDAILDEAAVHVREALAQPEIAAALARPAGSSEVWCERSFDVVVEGTWVTGVFDRVVVVCDATGQIERAEVLDYKTNVIEDEAHARQVAEEYRPQMESYRRALAVLLGLDPERVALKLLFTRKGRVVQLNGITSA